jgi:hypothetical protein
MTFGTSDMSSFLGQEYGNFGGNTVHDMAKVMHLSSRRFCGI